MYGVHLFDLLLSRCGALSCAPPVQHPALFSTMTSPTSARAPSRTRELVTDVANMLKAFIGINIMVVAYAFAKAGLIRGIFGLIVIAILTERCCMMLVHVKDAMPLPVADDDSSNAARVRHVPTYGNIARFAGGLTLELIVNVSLVVTQFGYCVSYLIFLSTTMHDLLSSTGPVWIFVFFPLPVLAALSFLTSIRSLGPFSLFANAALLGSCVAVVAFISVHFKWSPPTPSLSTFPLFFGQMTAALEGIGLVIPIQSSMTDPSRFPLVLRLSLLVLTIVLMTVGILGSITFGNHTRSIILLNFGASHVVTVVKTVLLFGILFTYPLQIVPVFQSLETWLLSTPPPAPTSHEPDPEQQSQTPTPTPPSSPQVQKTPSPAPHSDSSVVQKPLFISDWRKILLRLLVVSATAGVAIVGGASFGLFQSLIGSLGASNLAYTAPSLLHCFTFWQSSSLWIRFRNVAIIVFGLAGTVIGTITSILEMVAANNKQLLTA